GHAPIVRLARGVLPGPVLVTTRPRNGDFHEVRFMVGATTAREGRQILASHQPTPLVAHPPSFHPEETDMTWTTPAACDFRFGFEITMYIAAR
ncbi:MAG: pyrroloquinoline quinone precursor peptide PqqA, partial [Leptothrix sp. (in: b-proteobacteria)]